MVRGDVQMIPQTATMGPAESAFFNGLPGQVLPIPPQYLQPIIEGGAPQGLPMPSIDLAAGEATLELMSVEQFTQMFCQMHELAGAMVAMKAKLSQAVPYGEHARSPMGIEAAKSLYALLEMQPALARMVLSKESTFMGHLGAVLLHGFTLYQVTIAAVSGTKAPPPMPETTDEREAH